MYACVSAKFGMERCDQRLALGDRHWIVSLSRNRLHLGAHARNLRSADEYHLNRRATEQSLSNRAVDLPSVGVAANANVDCTQSLLCGILDFLGQQNRTCAGAERRLELDELLQFFEPRLSEKFEKGARLASGDDQSIDLVELLRFFYQHNFSAKLLQLPSVRVEVALQS